MDDQGSVLATEAAFDPAQAVNQGQSASETDATATASSNESSAPNWDDDTNPYKSRIPGFQKAIQQSQERNKALEAQLDQVQQRLDQLSVQHLDPMSQQAYLRQRQYERAVAQQQQVLTQQSADNEQQARVIAAFLLGRDHQVNPQELLECDTPREMERLARALSQAKRPATADHFEQPRTSFQAPKEIKSYQDASEAIIAEARRRGLDRV